MMQMRYDHIQGLNAEKMLTEDSAFIEYKVLSTKDYLRTHFGNILLGAFEALHKQKP